MGKPNRGKGGPGPPSPSREEHHVTDASTDSNNNDKKSTLSANATETKIPTKSNPKYSQSITSIDSDSQNDLTTQVNDGPLASTAVKSNKRKLRKSKQNSVSPIAKKYLADHTPQQLRIQNSDNSTPMSGVISESDSTDDEIPPNQNCHPPSSSSTTTSEKQQPQKLPSSDANPGASAANTTNPNDVIPPTQTRYANRKSPPTTASITTARINLNDPSYQENLPESTRHIILTSTKENTDLTKVNPVLIAKEIDSICGPIKRMEYL